MSDDIEKRKTEVERLGRLIDRYAQSRSLGLLIPVGLIVINTVLLLGCVAFLTAYEETIGEFCAISGLVVLWIILSIWLLFRLEKRYGYSFYKKNGAITLEKEKIPAWTYAAYLITLLGSAWLSVFNIMAICWGLTLALTSFGVFMLYVGKKHKEKFVGIVFGGLCLLEAAGTAAGIWLPLAGKGWIYSFFVVFVVYTVGAGLITAVVVHIYNRRILRKIKEMRPFGEQDTNKSDT